MGRLRVKPKLDRSVLMPLIRELEAKGMTQEQIAVECGCAQTTVQKWLFAEKPDDRQKKVVVLARTTTSEKTAGEIADGCRRARPDADGMQRRAAP